MSAAFVHLHVHTEYSLVDGLLRIKPLINAVVESAMPAIALTDQSNLFAMVKFYRAATANGIKPVFGVDAWIRDPADRSKMARAVLLCQNATGYRNVTELISLSYQEGQLSGAPCMEREWLAQRSEGVIVLSGGVHGIVGSALLKGDPDLIGDALAFWTEHFPDRFYLELHRTGRSNEAAYISAAVKIAAELNLPVVATNDVRFLKREDFEAHEARVCIHDGHVLDDQHRPKNYSPSQYLKTAEQMIELFSDIPEAIENTVQIARRCNVTLNLGNPVLPDFPIPPEKTEDEFFTEASYKGLDERLKVILSADATPGQAQREIYKERLQTELDVIIQMGFPGYFLIVADFIQWAKDNDIPVGPGRGSGAGSLVAFALKITDIDPIAYDLLFERFLNPERVSMPDFDIDFCMENRDRVIDYVARKYGRDKVSQIITYGSMAAKAVVRDVGRVLGQPYGFVDRIAKAVPFEIGMTLNKALEESEELKKAYGDDEEVTALIDLALKLEGISRNAGKHAGGVVIAPTRLTDFTPLYCEPGGGNLVTQFDKDDVEAIGLVKFDFLGLRTLTIIDWATAAVNERRAPEDQVDITRIPLDDSATFQLLKDQLTTAIFQLESRGMKDLIKRLQPDQFEDIVALVALFRPGPLQSGMVDDFIARKHGRAAVEYPHPDLEAILKPTYGVILYQEQVMQIAQVLANYSLGGADLLRRAMGKKKLEEMAEQREIFLKGSAERGVEADTATYIFDLMEKFAGYGFNKSHSAAYALLSYQTAWLKRHYPAEFMASVLSADMDNTDKVVTLIDDCRDFRIEVVPPDINRSVYRFKALEGGEILYGLGAIKGVGEGAIENLIQERERGGTFASIDDLCRRVETQKINRRVLEALIRAGALDQLKQTRASLMTWLPDALLRADQHHRDVANGQTDLFGSAATVIEEEAREPEAEWEEMVRLTGEKETLGLYLTGHPINRYLDELKIFTTSRLSELSAEAPPEGRRRGNERSVTVAGLIIAIRVRSGKRGKMAFVTLDDRSGRIEVSLFGDDFEKFGDILVKDTILVVHGGLAFDDFSGEYRLKARELFSIEQARGKYARYLKLTADAGVMTNGATTKLSSILQPYRQGKCPVLLDYYNGQAHVDMKLGADWCITPTDDCLRQLTDWLGEGNVLVEY